MPRWESRRWPGLADSPGPAVRRALYGLVLLGDAAAGGRSPLTGAGTAVVGVAGRLAGGRGEGAAQGTRTGTPLEGAREKELLEALGRHGALTVAGTALDTSLTVDEADRTLSRLAAKGHLEVRTERGRLLYSF